MGKLVTREDLRLALDGLDLRITSRMDGLALHLTVRLGVMMAAAVDILGTMVAISRPLLQGFSFGADATKCHGAKAGRREGLSL